MRLPKRTRGSVLPDTARRRCLKQCRSDRQSGKLTIEIKFSERRWIMKLVIISLAAVMVLAGPVAFAEIKPCEELKAEIDAKLKEKGVKDYTLEIIPSDQVKDQKIIGSCDGGTKKISYSRK
jgi:hypothetical protein